MHLPYSEASLAQVVVDAIARRLNGVVADDEDAATARVRDGCIGLVTCYNNVAYVRDVNVRWPLAHGEWQACLKLTQTVHTC